MLLEEAAEVLFDFFKGSLDVGNFWVGGIGIQNRPMWMFSIKHFIGLWMKLPLGDLVNHYPDLVL